MITEEMLALYCRFDGDIDGFARAGLAHERVLISDQQWYELDALLQELHLAKANLVSAKYRAEIEQRLSAMSASPRVTEWLWQLA